MEIKQHIPFFLNLAAVGKAKSQKSAKLVHNISMSRKKPVFLEMRQEHWLDKEKNKYSDSGFWPGYGKHSNLLERPEGSDPSFSIHHGTIWSPQTLP